MSDKPDFSIERQIARRLQQCRQGSWFEGQRAEHLWRWQVDHRQQLRRAMRLDLPPVYTSPRIEVIRSWEREGLRAGLLALETEEDFWLPVHILEPPEGHEGRIIILLHGCGRGAAEAVGSSEFLDAAGQAERRQIPYAANWARAGFIVAVPELRGFGRLALAENTGPESRQAGQPSRQLCSLDRLMAIYVQLGQTYAGCCVTDLIRLIDYLEARQGVDADRIGIAGIGEGSRAISWLVAMEDRIAVAAASTMGRLDPGKTAEGELGSLPMIGTFGLADPVSMFACYVPKPLYLQTAPPSTDAQGDRKRSAIERLERLYRLCGAEERLVLDVRGGSMALQGSEALSFFGRWL
jgi:dienelactone hydrolase